MIKEYILSSKIVWKLSGISYRTAVSATRGNYMPKQRYLDDSRNQMQTLLKYFQINDKVLEFGCGLGGNLIAIADNIKNGVGIDINSLFIRQANKLMKLTNKQNISFLSYNGKVFPKLGRFNSIFSIGVFERIPKKDVIYYLTNLKKYITEDGQMLMYFLNEEAKKTAFIERLGENAYVYWSQNEVDVIAGQLGLEIINIFPWGSGTDMYIFQIVQR